MDINVSQAENESPSLHCLGTQQCNYKGSDQELSEETSACEDDKKSNIRPFNKDWEILFPWAEEDNKNHRSMCKVCMQPISNRKSHHLRHEKTKKHNKRLKLYSSLKGPIPVKPKNGSSITVKVCAMVDQGYSKYDESSAFKWTKDATELLISEIKSHYAQIQNGVKKSEYSQIAATINSALGTSLTYEQIDSKWKGLNRTYKKMLMEKHIRGSFKRTWEFFDQIEDILNSAEVDRPAVSYSHKPTESDHSTDESEMEFEEDVDTDLPQLPTNVHASRKRRYDVQNKTVNSMEKRHRDKINVANRIIDLFEQKVAKTDMNDSDEDPLLMSGHPKTSHEAETHRHKKKRMQSPDLHNSPPSASQNHLQTTLMNCISSLMKSKTEVATKDKWKKAFTEYVYYELDRYEYNDAQNLKNQITMVCMNFQPESTVEYDFGLAQESNS